MAFLSFLLLLLGLGAVLVALLLRRRTGLPWRRIAYQDLDRARAPSAPLFAPRLGLTGRPDLLLEVRGRRIPVEVKPNRRAAVPYERDRIQVLAYCLLVEEVDGTPPPYGLLRYADATFQIPYTPDARRRLLALIEEMRDGLEAEDCPRSHNDPARCRRCLLADQCEEALL